MTNTPSNTSRLTILSDNTVHTPGLHSEWGLSMFLELHGQRPWLWDTGASPLFLDNAQALDLDGDMLQAEGVALSHGHFDHTGGLEALFASGFAGRVVTHPRFDEPRFAMHAPGDEPRSIGNPPGMPRPLPRLETVDPVGELAPGLTFLTGIPHRPGAFTAVSGFYRDPAGNQPDSVPDDAFLYVESGGTRTVVLGCCHAGLANSLEHLRAQLGIDQVDIVIGGLHLYRAREPALDESAEALEQFGVRRVYAGHCTGEHGIAGLHERLGSERVLPMGAGAVIPLVLPR